MRLTRVLLLLICLIGTQGFGDTGTDFNLLDGNDNPSTLEGHLTKRYLFLGFSSPT